MSDDAYCPVDRRTVLAATAGVVGVAGCSDGGSDGGTTTPGTDGTPEQIGGLQLWLHPDSETVTADGGVETWRDASGNGFDFTQSESARRPTLAEDAASGHPALRFDGTDDRFVREDALDIPDDSARTFVVVCRLSDPAARSPYLMQGTFGSSGGGSNYYGLEANTFNTAGERFGLYLVSVGNDSERATNTAFNVHVVRTAEFPELTAIEDSTTYYVNGTQVPFESTAGNARNSPFEADSTAIGAFPQSSPSVLMEGEIAEIRVYDRALDDSERSSLETRLLEKYGIDA